MEPEDFETLATVLKSRSGLALTPDKTYLLESRLLPVARARGLDSLAALVAEVRRGDEKLLAEVTEAMTTNESFFFRDKRPFEQFAEVVLPEITANRPAHHRIRIWSAACSCGQEPYSLAMTLHEKGGLGADRVEIVATDISDEMLAKARRGVYSQFEVQRGLPIQLLVKYFAEAEDGWQLNDSIRRMVTIKKFNLLDPMAPLGQFDVVFCRNVLIYFDQETKADVLARIRRQIADDGYLLLGGAETVLGISDRFAPVAGQRGLYAPAAEPLARAAG